MRARALVSLRARALLLGCALQILALPALAELRYFYCYVPDAASGNVYVSDTHPVGPVAERGAYGAEFLAYLKKEGMASSAQNGYCTMRASESEIQQSQRDLLASCRECVGATRLSTVPWNRRATTTQVAPSSVLAPQVGTSVESSSVAGRGELCVTNGSVTTARRQDCINKKPVLREAEEVPTTTTARPAKKRSQPSAPPRAEAPPESSPAPAPRRKTQACTTLPREVDTVIVVVDPEIFVTMTPGTYLYMRDHLGNELKLGYGKHRVRPGTYKLGIYGVTDPLNPLKQTLQACVAYYTDF